MVGSINREAILKRLLAGSAGTVRELAKLTSLSVPAVSRTLGEFVESGLVVSDGPLKGRLGRRPLGYRIAETHRHVVAVDLGQVPAVVSVGTLGAEIVARSELDVRGREFVAEVLVAGIGELLEEAGVPVARVAAVSVANPGIVDPETGTMSNPAEAGTWAREPLRLLLAEALGVPVVVMNDLNMATLGELHHGAGRGVADFVFVRLDVGVAAGIVHGGQLVIGANGAAGEIGNLRLGAYGAPDPEPRIEDRLAFVQKAVAAGRREELDQDLVAAGLGDIVGIVSALMDPGTVLLGGRLSAHLDDGLLEAVELRAARHMVLPPVIRRADLGADGALIGGLAVAVDSYLAEVAMDPQGA